MGPPSMHPLNGLELTPLDEIPPSLRHEHPGVIPQSPQDDYDDHEDADGGGRALLGEGVQTRWERERFSSLLAIWKETSGIVVETLPTLLFTTLSSLFTGELFSKISHWKAMTSVNELIAIVPVILNLKGNIEMNLSARLGTASNMGDLDIPSVRDALILGNLALLQVQAAVVSFIAACFSYLLCTIIPGLGEESPEPFPANTRDRFREYLRIPSQAHSPRRPLPTLPQAGAPKSGFHEFMVVTSTAMSAACVSSILLGSFMCFLVVICRRLGRDPDNIAPPIASCLGDLVTMSLIGAMSTLLVIGADNMAPFLVIGAVVLWAIVCAYIVMQNEYVKPLLKEGWTPLLGAMVITSGSGIVLDFFVSRYVGYALLAVAFGGIPGGTGSIFVSRLSTSWHVAASAIHDDPRADSAGVFIPRSSHARREPSPHVVMLVLLLVAMPVGLIYFLVLRLSAWLATSFAFSMLALFFLCIAIILSLVVAYIITNHLSRHGYDPDMYAMPIHSAIMDLLGQLLLVSSFELASLFGLHVRTHLAA
ncbi:Mg transporter [Russula earlei]|uniref:Mg transporter n=1 Tax=Russula earlei TaxID=71964 RepID=A0ACC0TYH6_9AGAM|nr:Mg transporter [Russula earlei]